ncbi:TonB-dependent receptor [Gluconacetobacter sacchari DSM 12717]|uniref:TonB-dependent receptor n=1 Tax=Gluconacetobacter sacchari DSM 12717 TaxID=1307940 RepID=A0ABQ0PDH7_9PROT|nr:TonB-dependent receptor [Gluconacetobacter sacchari]GBQ33037.1 TonB-dependent receptor [Gluconacetobacter sacchari DSM 12717]
MICRYSRPLLGRLRVASFLAGATALSTVAHAADAAKPADPSPAAKASQPPKAQSPKAQSPAPTNEVINVLARPPRFAGAAAQHELGSTTTISSEVLVARHVTTVTDLQNLVPNLTIQTQGGSNAPDFYLRGIGLSDYTQNNTPSVMTYFDDVAYPLAALTSGMMFDLQEVNVDAGPVGFAHGMADTGGEVRIRTNGPSRALHYGLSEDIASYNRSKTNVYLSGSLADTVQFRIAGQALEGGAFRFNRATGQSIGNANAGGFRAKLDWEPDTKTVVRLGFDWSQDNSDAMAGFVRQDLTGQFPPDRNIYATGWKLNPHFADLIGIPRNAIPSNDINSWATSLRVGRDLGWATLTSISSYAAQVRHQYIDRDATPVASADSYLAGNTGVFSQEIRLDGSTLHNRLDWVAGLYYSRIRSWGENWLDETGIPTVGYIQETTHSEPQQNFSQFAQARYTLLPGLKLTAGIEHQSDDRQFNDVDIIMRGISSHRYPDHGALTNQFSGKVGLQYQVTPRVMIYGDIRRGVKPGGFTANTTLVPSQLDPFKPEWLLAYEAGFKTELFDHRLRINGAAYWDEYHDQQTLGVLLIPPYGMVGDYINVPRSTIWGTELQIQANPLPGLTLTQNLGYERGQYDDYSTLNTGATGAHYLMTHQWQAIYSNYAGADMGIPKLTLSGSAAYKTGPIFNSVTLTPEIDYSFRSAQALQPRGSGPYLLPAYFLLNASLTVKPVHGRWSVTAYATNLANRDYIVAGTLVTTTLMGISGQPRFVGGRVAYDF